MKPENAHPVLVDCETCGRVFFVPPSQGSAKFCSRDCWYKSSRFAELVRRNIDRTRALSSSRLRELNKDPDFKKKRLIGLAKSPRARDYREIVLRERLRKLNRDPAFRRLLTARMREAVSRPEVIEKKREISRRSPRVKAALLRLKPLFSTRMRILNHDPNVRRKQLRGLMKRPTKLEEKFQGIVNRFALPYAYCGNGGFIRSGKCPDFIRDDGKQVVEIFVSYWHEPAEEAERIRFWKDQGVTCLVLWDRDLKDDLSVVSRIRERNDDDGCHDPTLS